MICITDKGGIIHIVDYGSRGKYRTLCYKKIHKSDNVNTFAADAAIRNGCPTCMSAQNQMDFDDLKFSPRSARGVLIEFLTELLLWSSGEQFVTPEIMYGDAAARDTRAIKRYKKLVTNRAGYVPER